MVWHWMELKLKSVYFLISVQIWWDGETLVLIAVQLWENEGHLDHLKDEKDLI